MKFSLELYAKRNCLKGVPVSTTKWHFEADNIEKARERAERIRARLDQGRNEIFYQNLKAE